MFTAINQYFTEQEILLLIPLIPLVGAALSYIIGSLNRKFHFLSGIIATICAFKSFVFALYMFIQLRQILLQNPKFSFKYLAWEWINTGSVQANLALVFDNLAAVMTLIVTGVGSLIHLYAIGYMADDENRPRFFAYLNLFIFSMLLLVLADSLLLMFVGWEGVGLCSYLLIGFWYKDMNNSKAGQKAFVVNRIGDAGFILGMALLSLKAGSLDFNVLKGSVDAITPATIELAAALLFIGAIGKSAQIPLFVWLPDAMAGPTPVSALIHAATMVTAGVYMVCRMSFLYVLAPWTLLFIGVLGALTALLAATIALAQNDIKKVLAYSTVSQLGYMFMALGAGAFSNGIYHVVTHAFFKACLFLAAGSVIISCHHEQDMRKFGGLYRKMPFTFVAYLIAMLAIAGIPFSSGYYSKDAILWTVFSNQGLPGGITIGGVSVAHILWAIGVITALLTALYMTRSLVMTFFGSYRGEASPQESSLVIVLPLLILASLSAGYGYFWGDGLINFLQNWTRPDMQIGHHGLLENDWYHKLEIFSGEVAVFGVIIALLFGLYLPKVTFWIVTQFKSVHSLLVNKWYVDELYEIMIITPLASIAQSLFKIVDRILIDAFCDGAAELVQAGGTSLRKIQTGKLTFYLSAIFVGDIFLIGMVYWLVMVGK